MEVPQKIKNRTTRSSSNSTSKYLSEENNNKKIQKDTCTSIFFAAFFTIAKIWKQSKCPSIDEWIKKKIYPHTYTHTHTHMHAYMLKYYSAIKKNEKLPFATTWIDLEV